MVAGCAVLAIQFSIICEYHLSEKKSIFSLTVRPITHSKLLTVSQLPDEEIYTKQSLLGCQTRPVSRENRKMCFPYPKIGKSRQTKQMTNASSERAVIH